MTRIPREPQLGSTMARRVRVLPAAAVVSILFIAAVGFGPMASGQERSEALTRAQMAANQVTAVTSLRLVNTSEIMYDVTFEAGYSPTLAALGPPPAGAKPSASAAGLIDNALAHGKKSGYSFSYSPGPKDAKGHIKSYRLVARPLAYKKTGTNSYLTDDSGTIHQTSEDRPATDKDPQL